MGGKLDDVTVIVSEVIDDGDDHHQQQQQQQQSNGNENNDNKVGLWSQSKAVAWLMGSIAMGIGAVVWRRRRILLQR
jgi:hypothetical protein